MTYAVHLHNHMPRSQDGLCPVEIWSRSKSTYSQLQNAHPWGCPTYVLDPRLQDGFKIPRWEPRSRKGIFVGVSPLHASTVALILNPSTNRLSPQFHCVFDDHFDTVHHDGPSPPPNWDELVLKSRFKNDIETDLDDTWDNTAPVAIDDSTLRTQWQPDNTTLPDVRRLTPDKEPPAPTTGPSQSESPSLSGEIQSPSHASPSQATEDQPLSSSPRRSSRM